MQQRLTFLIRSVYLILKEGVEQNVNPKDYLFITKRHNV